MLEKIRKWLFYAGMEPEQFRAMLPQTRRDNGSRLKMCASVSSGMFAVLFIAGLFMGDVISVNETYYGLMLLFSLVVWLCAIAALPKQPSLTPVLVYLFAGSVQLFSLGIALLHPAQPAVTGIAIMIMVPLLFHDRPIYFIMLTVIHVVLLCVMSRLTKNAEIATLDFWNGLSFGIIAIVVGYFRVEGRFRMVAQANHIRYLSETDLLTGAKNRNCYENRQRDYADRCTENVVCVYVDVNGLHELNNARGHAAGDEMLKTVAAALIDAFGAENTYRIGGDEFVAYGTDIPEEEAQRQMKRISAAMVNRHYHISVGVASQPREELDMARLTARAEEAMFVDKRRYYQQTGHDRRSHGTGKYGNAAT